MSTATTPLVPSAAPEARVVTERPPTWRVPITLAVFGIVALVAFGLGSASGETSTFGITLGSEAFEIAPLELPTRTSAIVLSVACLALAGFAALRVSRQQQIPLWVTIGFAANGKDSLMISISGQFVQFSTQAEGPRKVVYVQGVFAADLKRRKG